MQPPLITELPATVGVHGLALEHDGAGFVAMLVLDGGTVVRVRLDASGHRHDVRELGSGDGVAAVLDGFVVWRGSEGRGRYDRSKQAHRLDRPRPARVPGRAGRRGRCGGNARGPLDAGAVRCRRGRARARARRRGVPAAVAREALRVQDARRRRPRRRGLPRRGDDAGRRAAGSAPADLAIAERRQSRATSGSRTSTTRGAGRRRPIVGWSSTGRSGAGSSSTPGSRRCASWSRRSRTPAASRHLGGDRLAGQPAQRELTRSCGCGPPASRPRIAWARCRCSPSTSPRPGSRLLDAHFLYRYQPDRHELVRAAF